jgi:spermidine synthase
MVVALIGLYLVGGIKQLWWHLWMPVVIVVLFILGVRGTDKTTTGLVYETESAYNYIQVIEQNGYTMLRLNEGQGIHSIYQPDQYNFNGTWEQVLSAPFFNSAPVKLTDVTDIAIVGLAAGTTAREAAAAFPNVQIDGIEIDPVIVEVGRKYFDMNEPNLNVIIQDGRWALENSNRQYDVISIDAYRPPYIPYSLTSREFFQVVYDHLKTDGVVVINVGRGGDDRRLIDSLYATIASIFPTLYVTDLAASYNTMIFATKQPTTVQNFMDNYLYLYNDAATPRFVLEILAQTYDGLQPAPTRGMVFTDDLAPVEGITNAMVIDYLLSGKVSDLQ